MRLQILILERAREYIQSLSVTESASIMADIKYMEQGEFDAVYTKQLNGAIRELIKGNHRIPYFLLKRILYFVSGFLKKGAKTPKKEITYAKKIYTLVAKTK